MEVDGTVRFRNDTLTVKNSGIRVEFVPKGMVVVSSLDDGAITELGKQIDRDVNTFLNRGAVWDKPDSSPRSRRMSPTKSMI